MTRLSFALNTSLTGLALAGRMTQTISHNVANALTDGYAAREVVPTSRSLGGHGVGVAVGSIQRNVDPVLLAERRLIQGNLALADTRSSFLSDIQALIGSPDSDGSLTKRFAAFSTALVDAASRPDSDVRLQSILNSASAATSHLNLASDSIQSARMRADQDIGRAVEFINTTLQQISELNVPKYSPGSDNTRALDIADQRQALVDQLSEYVPVREIARDNGTIALFTPGGAILLDRTPAEFEFSPVGLITPEMNVGAGTLLGLSINGQPIDPNAESGKIAGGQLAALFDIRDVQAPALQARLDAVARDLVERFQDPAVDATLAVGDAGFFTDNGAAFAAANEVGLSSRISVHASVDPAQGGALWRLRDGINAATPGPVGNSTLINAFDDALNAARVPNSGGFSVSYSAHGVAAEFFAGISEAQSAFSFERYFKSAQFETLKSAELKNGVDTDQEMQRLLLVEQAYAANARVISTID